MTYLLTDSPPALKRPKVNPSLIGGVPGGGSGPGKTGEFLSPEKKKKIKGKGGSSCHQCKSRRNDSALTYCTSNLDKKNKKCRKKFCGHCLKKFYKETPQGIPDRTAWKCPSCRKICCCAACRRRKQRDSGSFVPSSASKPKPSKKPMPILDSSGGTVLENDHREFLRDPSAAEFDQKNHAGMSMMSTPIHYQSHHQHLPFPASGSAVPPSREDQDPLKQEKYNQEFFNTASFSPIMMATELSSPVATPLHVPASFGDFPSISLSQDYDEREPKSDGPSLLEREIQKQAKQASQDRNNNQFAHLYRIAQTPEVQKMIHHILLRTDISQDQKVEDIAQLLRVHCNQPVRHFRPAHIDNSVIGQHPRTIQTSFGVSFAQGQM